MSKNDNKIQKSHQVSEPAVVYGTDKHDLTPEELYSVIVDEVMAIVEEEIITDERDRIILI